MKRTLSLMLAALFALSALAAFPANVGASGEEEYYFEPEDYVTSGDWTYGVHGDGSTVTIVRYNGSATEVAIPTEIDGHTVTRIAWADDNVDLEVVFGNTLEAVTIPETVTTIGASAFAYCTSLKEITIPESVTKLEEYAFMKCRSLKTITIPDSVTDLGYQTFTDCTSLESVVIGDGVTGFGAYVFADCTALTSVTLGKNVKWIGLTSFQNCTALKHIEFPEGMEEIGAEAFQDCTSLESITVPVSVTKIDGAFCGCTALKKVYYGGTIKQWNEIEVDGWARDLLDVKNVVTVPPCDLNGDAKINAKDVILLMKSLVSGNKGGDLSGDLNADGSANAKDVIELMRFLVR